eukprot:1157772-Pelagomonas_calceolata.AAC.1
MWNQGPRPNKHSAYCRNVMHMRGTVITHYDKHAESGTQDKQAFSLPQECHAHERHRRCAL